MFFLFSFNTGNDYISSLNTGNFKFAVKFDLDEFMRFYTYDLFQHLSNINYSIDAEIYKFKVT
jgi:hypothetical protein